MVDYNMSIVIGIEHSIFDLIINIEGHKQYTKYHTIKPKLLLNLIRYFNKTLYNNYY